MIYTLLHAREFVNKYVENGTCPTKQIVVERINEACRRLMHAANWSGTTARIRFTTTNNTLTLPRGALRVLAVDIDTSPRRVFGQSYEFLENGPGELGIYDGFGSDLLDLGDGYPTFFTVREDTPARLVAFSTAAEDVSQVLTVMGLDSNNGDILTAGLPGVQVPINRWMGGVEGTINASGLQYTSQIYKDVTAVHKPVTKGYVSLYTYNPTDSRMYFLAKYHPDETNPGYRRYRITMPDFEAGKNVLCWVKMRFEPLSHDTDILPIQNLDALKQEVIAIREENDRNNTVAEGAHNKAVRLLNEQEQDSGDSDGAAIQVVAETGLGGIMSIM